MVWMNQLELEQKYREREFQDAFANVFALHLFLDAGLFPPDYKPRETWREAVSLTPLGAEWLPRIKQGVSQISDTEAKLALFMKFFHQDLFIDVFKTKTEVIADLLDAEILAGRIRYPWVYHRMLYDRFFDMFPSLTRELTYNQTTQLLENSPQGVFQVRDILIGPFGVLRSACQRFLQPAQSVPLWHCSDPSCNALHPVLLSSGKNKAAEGVAFIWKETEKLNGHPSEWTSFFLNFAGAPDHYDDMHLQQFPWLLTNAFSEREIRNILRRLIGQHSKEIRQRFPNAKRFQDILSGSADNISERLNKPQCFQLILLMADEVIVNEVEFLIEQRVIKIPSTETRTPVVTYGPGGWLPIYCQASRFGVRSIPSATDIAVARLKRLIKQLYKDEQQLTQLRWKLRRIEGENIYVKLDRYLRTEDPKGVVTDLVFASPDRLQQAFQNLRYGSFVLPSSSGEEEYLIDKILWKLSFDIGLYPPHQRLFWERLEKFLDTARTHITSNEHDRELIRSACVNLFVSLEEILDHSLSFMTWALLSDHYDVTKFKCNVDEARRFMALRLNGLRLGSTEPLEFDAAGKNTLYPLIQGFAVLADLCTEILEGGSSELRRPENELPGFHGKTEIELFPFLHKALILDLRKGDCDQMVKLLRGITTTFEKSQVCNIRNRIQHPRPDPADFPSKQEIERACGAVEDTVRRMEEVGVCPLIYLYAGRTIDEYGRGFLIFKDYQARVLRITHPSQYRLCNLPSIRQPQIIVKGMHIGDSSEYMRFQFEEASDYVEMWLGYPKRRTRVGPEVPQEELASEQTQSDTL